MALFYTPDIEKSLLLPEEEAAHALRVLRLGRGDALDLTDGKGHLYRAEIDAVTGKKCTLRLLQTITPPPLWQGYIHVAVAPTKNNDRTEWFVEKATEIGVNEISFLNCRYSERRVLNLERMEKIAVSAIKQSLKAVKPLLNPMTDFEQFIRKDFDGLRLMAHCEEGEEKIRLSQALQAEKAALVLIGPEGDFSNGEIRAAREAGFRPVSLGGSRLRTETAALVACHTYYLIHQC